MGFPKITKKDLEEKDLFRLNNLLEFMAGKISALEGASGVVRISNTVVAEDFLVENQDKPDSDSSVVNWGVAKKYFSPQAQRQSYIRREFLGTPLQGLPGTGSGGEEVLFGTHAERLLDAAAGHPVGTIWLERDRYVVYVVQEVSGIPTWVFFTGTMRDVTANRPTDLGTSDVDFKFFNSQLLVTYRWNGTTWHYYDGVLRETFANKPAGLTTSDVGHLYYVTDFHHLLRWSGTAWEWAPGDEGSGFIRAFAIAPSPSTGWQVCDGTATSYLKADGTTAGYTTETLTSGAYLKYDSVSSATVQNAIQPTIFGPTNTGTVAAGATGSGTANIGVNNGNVTVAAGVGADVAGDGHTHSDSGHTHSVPAHAHTIGTITAAADAEMRHTTKLPYFRR